MPQSNFGVGFLYATPAGASPTPTKFGALQDISVDFSFDLKELYGTNQFALEQARGKAKIALKATIGRIDPIFFNTVVFGLTTATGQTLSVQGESGTVTAAAYTVANASTWTQDLGVYDTTTKLYLSRVASAPAVGQYSVAAGVYTFNTAANTHVVQIDYTYSSVGTGTSLTYTNQKMGSNITFALMLVNSFVGADGINRSLMMNFARVQCPKLSMPLKLDDFLLSQLDMSAQDDGNGNIFNYSMTG